MKTLHDHKINRLNQRLLVIVPEGSERPHRYQVIVSSVLVGDLQFHQGPAGARMPNGPTTESLLAIALDRLRCENETPGEQCREYERAIAKIEEALHWLAGRARRRGED